MCPFLLTNYRPSNFVSGQRSQGLRHSSYYFLPLLSLLWQQFSTRSLPAVQVQLISGHRDKPAVGIITSIMRTATDNITIKQ